MKLKELYLLELFEGTQNVYRSDSPKPVPTRPSGKGSLGTRQGVGK
jgi:hypothetical protein